jgi:hypothetical protein
MTGRIELHARGKIPSEQQPRLICQLGDFQHLPARQTMLRRDDGQATTPAKQPHSEVLVTNYRQPQVNIATAEAFREAGKRRLITAHTNADITAVFRVLVEVAAMRPWLLHQERQ